MSVRPAPARRLLYAVRERDTGPHEWEEVRAARTGMSESTHENRPLSEVSRGTAPVTESLVGLRDSTHFRAGEKPPRVRFRDGFGQR